MNEGYLKNLLDNIKSYEVTEIIDGEAYRKYQVTIKNKKFDVLLKLRHNNLDEDWELMGCLNPNDKDNDMCSVKIHSKRANNI